MNSIKKLTIFTIAKCGMISAFLVLTNGEIMIEKLVINEELYKDHENRPDLVGEHPFGDTLQLIMLIIFSIVIVADYLIFHTYDYFGGNIPIIIRNAGRIYLTRCACG